jgi:hypothetical protein
MVIKCAVDIKPKKQKKTIDDNDDNVKNSKLVDP